VERGGKKKRFAEISVPPLLEKRKAAFEAKPMRGGRERSHATVSGHQDRGCAREKKKVE